jgi:molybdate transport system ATP-binding protein
MMEAKLKKAFSARAESAAFALDIALTAGPGITVLFGPSGSGKTLTLDMIAGFIKPEAGRLLLDDQLLYDGATGVLLPPQQRRCSYVFQNYALFPHMTMRQNLEFAAHRWPRLERHRRVNEMLERFRLEEVAGRRPAELSGGQKQRCSIARALIGQPRLLLLDEPARGLDAPLREELYETLRQVRSQFQTPILLVTHDLEECFALGDDMYVMHSGRLVQHGTPQAIFAQPASLEVARLLGAFNLLPAEIVLLDPGRDRSRLALHGHELEGPYFPQRLKGDRVWVCARHTDVRALARDGRVQKNQIPAKLTRVVARPHGVLVEFEGGLAVAMAREDYERFPRDTDWLVEFPTASLRIL